MVLNPGLSQLDYPFVVGPWQPYMQPTLTLLRPSAKVGLPRWTGERHVGWGMAGTVCRGFGLLRTKSPCASPS